MWFLASEGDTGYQSLPRNWQDLWLDCMFLLLCCRMRLDQSAQPTARPKASNPRPSTTWSSFSLLYLSVPSIVLVYDVVTQLQMHWARMLMAVTHMIGRQVLRWGEKESEEGSQGGPRPTDGYPGEGQRGGATRRGAGGGG